MKNTKKKYLPYLNTRTDTKFAVFRHFYKWLWTPKPRIKNPDMQTQLIFLFKVYSARAYFHLGAKWLKLISWLTHYYPFSLFWQNRLIHAKNLPVRNLMDKLQNVSEKSEIPILLTGGGTFTDYCEMEGNFIKKVRNKDEALKKLETSLRSVYETIFVRNAGDGFTLIMPLDLLKPLSKK
jgi:hypothetical protein